ncbi:pentatricopeptide repeat-containing protein At2g35030, mitochondrial-like [Selaginella moellendorffii]|uniref:pentatricopeptide repeat-containing protein At2g35030, mitochondrial-like n=1 Tax=Selaginella moellendorffii TaxID=88036 RepID=UPI000D1CE8B5|nr:pentatricopeptide repeat-containing protein At2g35030, mitochondrial-like [Selaginella moellendorffii]|eukprot:XP_024537073.1 pentatricopeptide repeat-containing protein At2g35030, mitochondrial-like [Selaginella moellendorffii]
MLVIRTLRGCFDQALGGKEPAPTIERRSGDARGLHSRPKLLFIDLLQAYMQLCTFFIPAREECSDMECDSLGKCLQLANHLRLKKLFDRIINQVLWNSMIVAHAQCRDLDKARKFFARMMQRDSVSWATLINSFVRHGCSDLAKETLDRMPQHDVIDSVEWNAPTRRPMRQKGHLDDAWAFFRCCLQPNIVTRNVVIYPESTWLLDDAEEIISIILFVPDVFNWGCFIK